MLKYETKDKDILNRNGAEKIFPFKPRVWLQWRELRKKNLNTQPMAVWFLKKKRVIEGMKRMGSGIEDSGFCQN